MAIMADKEQLALLGTWYRVEQSLSSFGRQTNTQLGSSQQNLQHFFILHINRPSLSVITSNIGHNKAEVIKNIKILG